MKNSDNERDSARKILGISSSATAEDTKRAYHELAKLWHPDINPSGDASVKMKEINEAYALLMKEEFGVLDPWNAYNRWWLRQYGNDPIWSNYVSKDEEEPGKPKRQIS